MVIVGLLLTAAATATAVRVDRNSESRLLQVQTRQAAAVISGQVDAIATPLTTAELIESDTGNGAVDFDRYMSGFVGPGRLFASAVLWRTGASAPVAISSVGTAPEMYQDSRAAHEFIEKASRSATFVVTGIPGARPNRIGFAEADPQDPAVVIYAERAIPKDRVVSIESNAAFADLHFATYLGSSTADPDLTTTDVPVNDLPLSGTTSRITIPFGDTKITLVTSPSGHLSGSLSTDLPLIFTVVGILLSFAAGVVAWQLVRRRQVAERDATIITELYERLDDRYVEQRSISEALQRALLPPTNPSITNLEIATRYVAGADGVDVGGDWYSLVDLDDDQHFAFVVGDVSGRGVEAATLMARLRFTLRAYLLDGHSPEIALEMCAKHIRIQADRHFATVLVGRGDLRTRTIVMANAGHLKPLIIDGSHAHYVETPVGLPLGMGPSRYIASTITMTSGSTLIGFTDGLVERRGEDLQFSMEHLADTAVAAERRSDGMRTDVESVLSQILTVMTPEGPTDDIAILAFRWSDDQSSSSMSGERIGGVEDDSETADSSVHSAR